MSRVGKMPVTIPAGVDVSFQENKINVKGSGGALSLSLNALVTRRGVSRRPSTLRSERGAGHQPCARCIVASINPNGWSVATKISFGLSRSKPSPCP